MPLNLNQHLSPNFTLFEMVQSQTAARQGIDNTPGASEIANLKNLCQFALEPVRALFNVPLVISSGYRSPRLNRAVGGSSTSQHVKGEAADCHAAGYGIDDLFEAIAKSNIQVDQVIYEFGRWVHISYSTRRTRNQFMTAHRKRNRWGRTQTVYTTITRANAAAGRYEK